MGDFKVHTLGCGSAKPTRKHSPSSTVVDYRGNLYMVDCGEGAQKAFAMAGLRQGRLQHIFLTHLHGDHVFGLFGLIGTLALHAKGGHITIHTFEEGRRILETVNAYFNRDTPFEVRYNILDPHRSEIALDTGKLRVRTVPLRHRVPCVGYVFEEAPHRRHINKEMCDFHGVPLHRLGEIADGADFTRGDGRVIPNAMLTRSPSPSLSYAHLGDTSYFQELAAEAGPVTLMMHETTYLDSHAAEAPRRGHSTARQAGITAREAGAEWLLTGHYSSRYDDDRAFAAEAGEEFPRVILNREGLSLDLMELHRRYLQETNQSNNI